MTTTYHIGQDFYVLNSTDKVHRVKDESEPEKIWFVKCGTNKVTENGKTKIYESCPSQGKFPILEEQYKNYAKEENSSEPFSSMKELLDFSEQARASGGKGTTRRRHRKNKSVRHVPKKKSGRRLPKKRSARRHRTCRK